MDGSTYSTERRNQPLSIRLFRYLYGEEFWGYTQRRIMPIVRERLASVDGAVVDAACGAWNPYLGKLPSRETIGIDVDEAVRERNTLHRNFVIQDLHDEIGLKNVGAVLSINTWEHLHSPNTVLNNFQKILKTNGTLIIIAPQKYYYISLLTLVLSTTLRDWAWRAIKRHNRMPFPAYYRLCSRKSLAQSAAASGLELVEYQSFDVASEWFLRFPPLFLFACGWMSLMNRFEVFAPLRSGFVAVLRKPNPAAPGDR